MPQILDVLMLGRCSHEFSWPRRAANGEYYQVCLLCAAEYKYDWKTMRRIERVEHSMPEPTVGRSQIALEEVVLGTACPAFEAANSVALSSQKSGHVVGGDN